MITIEQIIEAVKEYNPDANVKKIREAYEFAAMAHAGMKRQSGEDYIQHSLATSLNLAKLRLDTPSIIAGLLHDVPEDTSYTLEDIKKKFGKEVVKLVEGITKLGTLKYRGLERYAENLRKMFLAMAEDIRVILIKFADRMHNLETLEHLRPDKRKRIALETLEIYAPIALRLGMGEMKGNLEDLAFPYVYPKEYAWVKKEAENKLKVEFKFIEKIKKIMQKELQAEGIEYISIHGRVKHIYSLYRKMLTRDKDIDKIYDLIAIRVVVKDIPECYRVLGLVHKKWKPLKGRVKDYIAQPKPNGYQSLHTTVFAEKGKIVEFQIREQKMHDLAEFGIAAHWIYKGKNNTLDTQEPCLNWLKSLGESNENIEEFYDDAKQNLFSEEVVVYSPKGDIFTLPRGSVAYDFAYTIHSDVGNKAISCTINKTKKPLLTELKNGDIVSINTSSESIARCSWIDMVKTTRAKKSIKVLCSTKLNTIDKRSGKNIINTIFSRYNNSVIGNIKTKVAFHKIPYILDYIKHVKKKIEKEIVDKNGIFARFKIKNLKFKEYIFDNIAIYSNFSINSVSFDHCCHPKFGDDILALKVNDSAVIHHKMCDKAYKEIMNDHKMFYCKWAKGKLFTYKMVVSLQSKRGELARLLTFLSEHEINILFIEYGRDKYSQTQYCEIEFETNDENKNKIKSIVEQQTRVIEFVSASDAYK